MLLNYCLSSSLVLATAQISWARANRLTTATSLRNTRVPRVTSWKPKLANMSSSFGSSHPPSGLHAEAVQIPKTLGLQEKIGYRRNDRINSPHGNQQLSWSILPISRELNIRHSHSAGGSNDIVLFTINTPSYPCRMGYHTCHLLQREQTLQFIFHKLP